MLFYDEVFASIQGESSDSGLPTIFVRLFGCNVKCSYCDQPQSKDDKKRISVGNLLTMIKSFVGINHVCITGGEPLIQAEVFPLIYSLVDMKYKVSIETNGCTEIDRDLYKRSFKYVMDIKCPSSGVSKSNKFANLTHLHQIDEVKFVIADEVDYLYAKEVLAKYPTKAHLLFSPMFNKDNTCSNGRELSEWIMRDKIPNSRMQIQLHKVLGVM